MYNIYETKKNNQNCLDDNVGDDNSFHGNLDDWSGLDVIFKIWKRFGN